MKKHMRLPVFGLLLVMLFSAFVCKLAAEAENATDSAVRGHQSLEGKRIAVVTGTIFDSIVENELRGTPVYYNGEAAALEDVRGGRVDGLVVDRLSALVILSQTGDAAFELIHIPEEIYSGSVAAICTDTNTQQRFNEFLAAIKADGTFTQVQNRWIEENPGADPPMPEISSSGENGEIRFVTSCLAAPFSYLGANEQLKGFCVELALRFAAHEGKTAVFDTTDFNGMIPYVTSNKADIGIDAITVTPERQKSVLFTDAYYEDRITVIVQKAESAALGNVDKSTQEEGGVRQWLSNAIERNLITDGRWKIIVKGLGVTITISLLSQLFGTLWGCVVCYLAMRKNRLVRTAARLYCALIHGTPALVLLMISYYIIFGKTEISNILIAVTAFTLVTGAGVAGILKGSIETVDPVEIEAARGIGFSALKAFFIVTLPQAVRRALPAYTTGFVELVKGTAVVGYIAIQDLTRAGDIIRGRTYDAYFPLLVVAVLYLIVTAICVRLFKFLIKKWNGGETR